MHDPLRGLRVLELSGGVATRYCGRLLARLGAEVTATGGGDEALGYGGESGVAFGRWLDEGKARQPGEPSAAAVDLVIAGQTPAAVESAAALTVAAGDERPPVLLGITWFHPEGPYASWRGTDEVVTALAGLAYSFGLPEGPPVLAQGHAPQLLAGVNAANAALAALIPPPGRRPRRVEVDVLESTMCLSEVATVAALDDARARSTRLGVNRFSPTYPCSSYRTSDGWVGITCLTPAQWHALCTMIGRPELASERRYSTAFRRLMRGDEVDEALAPALAARPTDEWVAEGRERRIPTAPMPRPGELPRQQQWRERESFAPLAATAVEAPTLPFRVERDGIPVARWSSDAGPGPLSGVRVVDFSMGWSGPQATRTLGDLGAEVVKIESAAHPDWYRGWEVDEGGDPPPRETRSSFNTLNRNKLGVALELDTPAGLEAARILVASADVVIENFAAGVLDKLGLGQDEQQRLRPGIVSVSMPAFGNGGPLSPLRAYGSTVEQASGLPFVNGDEEWAPCLQHVAYGDPVAGLFAVTAVLAGLAGRERLGGARIDLSQVECLFQLGADAVIAEQVTGRPVPRTGSRRARMAPCCVVPAAGDDAWLAVTVPDDRAWAGLVEVLGRPAWGNDPELATPEGRNRRADEVEAAIGAWSASQPAAEGTDILQAHGVAAAPVQPAHALGDDAQLAATGFWTTMERRYVGRHPMAATAFAFDRRRPEPRRPAPTLGEHTAEVLARAGLA